MATTTRKQVRAALGNQGDSFDYQGARPELIRSQPGGNTVLTGSSTKGLNGLAGSPNRQKHRCNRCQRPATLRCSRCKQVRYCTNACQVADWKAGHKAECTALLGAKTPTGSPLRDVMHHSPNVKRDVKASASGNDDNILLKPQKILYPFEAFQSLYEDFDEEEGDLDVEAGDENSVIEIGSDFSPFAVYKMCEKCPRSN